MSRVRWSVVLPIVMLVVSTLLMVLATKQAPMLQKMGTGWEVPARVLNGIVNGPGFYLTWFLRVPRSLDRDLDYDGNRLLGIVLFWFCIGQSLDGRGSTQSLGRRHPIPIGVLSTFGALVCGFFGIGLGVTKFGEAISWKVIATWPLRSSDSMALALVVWLLVLCGYFCRRAFILAQQSPRPIR
jgi:hypothetical protein